MNTLNFTEINLEEAKKILTEDQLAEITGGMENNTSIWIALCASCNWTSSSFDRSRLEDAANQHTTETGHTNINFLRY